MKGHPLSLFRFCPRCGSGDFRINNFKSKKCGSCGFVYYFNPSAAVACFIHNGRGEVLAGIRLAEPAKGTLDLIGGFVDSFETAEDAARREISEETGIEAQHLEYIFSWPNIYPYSGFEVHTVDMFFDCMVESFDGAAASDDVSELVVVPVENLDPAEFGLESVRKAAGIYKDRYIKNKSR